MAAFNGLEQRAEALERQVLLVERLGRWMVAAAEAILRDAIGDGRIPGERDDLLGSAARLGEGAPGGAPHVGAGPTEHHREIADAPQALSLPVVERHAGFGLHELLQAHPARPRRLAAQSPRRLHGRIESVPRHRPRPTEAVRRRSEGGLGEHARRSVVRERPPRVERRLERRAAACGRRANADHGGLDAIVARIGVLAHGDVLGRLVQPALDVCELVDELDRTACCEQRRRGAR